MPMLLLAAGCSDRYKEGLEKGYEVGHAAGLRNGYEDGAKQGRLDGQAEGYRRAEDAASRGGSLRFYFKPFFALCAGGAAIGIGLQYILLYAFRRNDYLHWTGVTLVPGLADSMCFRLRSRLGVLALEEKRGLEEVRTRTELRNAEIESLKLSTQKKIEASGDLESAFLRMMLKEADRKMQKIIDDAERHKSARPHRGKDHKE